MIGCGSAALIREEKEFGNGLMGHLGTMKIGGNPLNQITIMGMKIVSFCFGLESGLMLSVTTVSMPDMLAHFI